MKTPAQRKQKIMNTARLITVLATDAIMVAILLNNSYPGPSEHLAIAVLAMAGAYAFASYEYYLMLDVEETVKMGEESDYSVSEFDNGNSEAQGPVNHVGDNAYYHCGSCGIELNSQEVAYVEAGRNCASGPLAPCPECGSENSIDRDD